MEILSSQENDIAVIGISLRFPGKITTPTDFWEALKNSFDGVVKIPSDRWSDSFQKHQLVSTKNAGLLDFDEWKKFDPLFFEISPKDADYIDPQERLLLTLVYEALEDAQIPSNSLRSSNTGVFVGMSNNDYHHLQLAYPDFDTLPKVLSNVFTPCVIANRVSYCFDFRGPSMTVDTACSSSLTTTDLAIKYLQDNQCDIAISCGINALFDPDTSRMYSNIGVLGDHCKPFDANASGFVRSEGCGVVILKKLRKAERDGNRIYSVIKGIGINNDGHCNKDTLSTPSSDIQYQNIKQTLEKSNIDPSQIYYVEAHSTGTVVGDPIEMKALIDMFSANHSPEKPLKVGSVKSNLGHLESASGIASIIKVSLMLKNRMLVPSIKLSQLNPKIAFKESNMEVITKNEEISNEQLIIMGVNSFGIGGTNGHMILQEYKKKDFDANSTSSIDKYFDLLQNYQDKITIKEFALNQSLTKSFHSTRKVVIAKNWEELNSKIVEFNGQVQSKDTFEKKLVYVFCGQGPQWNKMGMNLYENEPVFKSNVDKLDNLLKEYSGYSIVEKLKSIPDDSNEIHKPIIAQPSLFVFQVALYELYKHWGLTPSIVLGHSFGDITSAYISGNLNLSDAIKVVHIRASLQNETIGTGRMLVVAISSEKYCLEFQRLFPSLEIACFNSSNSIVITGDNNNLKDFADHLKKENIFHTFLRTPCSFHSSYQDIIKEKVINQMNSLNSKSSNIPWYSTVTGDLKSDPLDSQYVFENIRNPVYFQKTLESLYRDLKENLNDYVFLEISPHPTLCSFITQTIPKSKVLSPIQRKKDETLLFKSSLASLHCLGVNINFSSQFSPSDILNRNWRERVAILPRYQWDTDLYWNESNQSKYKRLIGKSTTILGHKSVTNGENCYQSDIDIRSPVFEYLKDHQVKNQPILPGAGYMEAIIEALEHNQQDIQINKLEFLKPVFLKQSSQKIVTKVEKLSKSEYSFEFFHKNGQFYDLKEDWKKTAKSKVTLLKGIKSRTIDLSSFKSQCNLTSYTPEEFYKKTQRFGLKYGPHFQHIQNISIGNMMAFGALKVRSSNRPSKILNATLFDSCAHGLFALMDDRRQFIYKSLENMKINYQNYQELENNPPEELYLLVRMTDFNNYENIGNCLLVNPKGQIIFEIKKYILGSSERMKLKKIKYPENELFETFYQPKESPVSIPKDLFSNQNKLDIIKETSESLMTSISKSISQMEGKNILKIMCLGCSELSSLLIPLIDKMLDTIVKGVVEIFYTISDVSEILVKEKKEIYQSLKIHRNLKINFTLVDFSQNLEEQGFLHSSYDLVFSNPTMHKNNYESSLLFTSKILSPKGTFISLQSNPDSLLIDQNIGDFNNLKSFVTGSYQFTNIRTTDSENYNMLICEKTEIASLPIKNVEHLSVVIGDNQNVSNDLLSSYTKNEINFILVNEIQSKKDILRNSTHILFLTSMEQLTIENYQLTIYSLVQILQMLMDREKQPRITVVAKDSESSNYLSNSIVGILNTAFVDHRELDVVFFNIDSSLNNEYLEKIMIISQNKVELGEYSYAIMNNKVMIARELNIEDEAFTYSKAYETNPENIISVSNINLDYKLRNRRNLNSKEVEIEVKAVGLNFKDYLFHLQMLPEKQMSGGDIYHPPFGLESSGVVSRLGKDVDDFKIGDEPKELSFNECASVSIVYGTVYHSLFEVCKFKPDETILIHGATGGVGLAAMNVLRMLKCKRVYATAGSQEKIDYLKSNYSDILIDVFNSYSNEFAESIKEQCDGVNVLLNTLPIEYMEENFRAMAPYGRIADIVVTHIVNNDTFGYGQFDNDINYCCVDLQKLFWNRTEYGKNLMITIFNDIASGRLQLTPIKVFDVTETKQAIKHIAERKQLGKVVIDCSNFNKSIMQPLIEKKIPLPKKEFKMDISNTIIVTGQNGLALELIPWLAKHTNASDIVVLSKSTLNNRLKLIINSTKSTKIHFYQTDITDNEQLKSRIELAIKNLPPIETIIHLAVLFEAVPLNELTLENIKRVHDPKVIGAYNLHTLSIDLCLPLKQFVLMSSISGYTGAASQPSYNSSCLAIDGLCKYRNSLGLTSKAIRLGPILGEGIVAESTGLQDYTVWRFRIDSFTTTLLQSNSESSNFESSIRDTPTHQASHRSYGVW
ncbi:polyketide synthase [Heterostelium album PN500]|uniref:Polyketide synthase n=1 Tax=Heterostelium pallidum (strain ATCC 26659 / Pp 5 / PN500) TaxID=670386 RepID=D3B7D7_HETP5|nr:polyketide synthase [Heterostelium album PN500]EFA82680.1 polyketide synthase [Heterostelium album PN500]|eukprot:XP_020434797.1 polyketide synthase [Heterostelium album PN500]